MLVQGALRNCGESGREQRLLETTSRSAGKRSLPGGLGPLSTQPSGCTLSELRHRPLRPLCARWLGQGQSAPAIAQPRGGPLFPGPWSPGAPVSPATPALHPASPPGLLTATGRRGCPPIPWARNRLPGPRDAMVGSHRTQLVRSREALSRREQGHPGELTHVTLT